LGIRLFFGTVPLAILLIALPLLIRCTITRRSHPELRQKLDSVDAGAAVDK
jgi:Na+/melibiose symporter-like transporter